MIYFIPYSRVLYVLRWAFFEEVGKFDRVFDIGLIICDVDPWISYIVEIRCSFGSETDGHDLPVIIIIIIIIVIIIYDFVQWTVGSVMSNKTRGIYIINVAYKVSRELHGSTIACQTALHVVSLNYTALLCVIMCCYFVPTSGLDPVHISSEQLV
jgi:hypothetical protein